MKKGLITYVLTAGLIGTCVFQGQSVNVEAADSGTKIHFIALKGDTEAILLESNGHFGMIDSGEDTDYPDGSDPRYPLRPGTVITAGYEEQVIEYMRSLGVNEDNFEFYIGTHAHSDHIGSADEIIREFEPDRVYLTLYDDSFITNESGLWDNQYIYDNAVLAAYDTGATLIQQFNPDLPADSYTDLELPEDVIEGGDGAERVPNEPYTPQEGLDLRDESEVYAGPGIRAAASGARAVPSEEENRLEDARRSAKQGSTHLTLGEMELEIFNYNAIEELGTVWDVNEMSLCVKVSYNGNTACLGGDLSVEREKAVASQIGEVNLLKSNHHGYSSSNSYEFISALSPEITVVTGANIGLVAQRLNQMSSGSAGTTVKIYATDWYYGQVDALVFDMSDFSTNVSEAPLIMAGTADSAYTLFLDGYKYSANGLTEYNGKKYYFNSSPYAAVNEWNTQDGKWYYSGSDGEIQTGWLTMDGSWVYITDDYEKATGWLTVDGDSYYLNEDGVIQTGWLTLADATYYLDKNGKAVKGWHLIDGALYYFDENSQMLTGEQTIDGKEYRFDEETGKLLVSSYTGWQQFGSNWFYFDQDGTAKTGWQYIGSSWYYFNENGRMCTGWQNVDGKWYYMAASGAMQTGWQMIGGIWYYMDGSGAQQTGWQLINGTWYYMDESGAMQTGWQYIGGTWYYLSGSGAMTTGWQYIGGTWYYLGGSGAMTTGWQYIGGSWYYLSGSGAMTTGWQYIGGTWYYLSGSGAMTTGWQYIGGSRYYMSGSGAMTTGWQYIGGTWYYLKENGAMAVSEWIDNIYYVDDSGAWTASA